MSAPIRAALCVLAATLIQGCNPLAPSQQSQDIQDGSVSEEQSSRFLSCVEQSTIPPWRVARAITHSDEFSLYLEADSSALAIPTRPGDFPEQRLVRVDLGRFHRYMVVDPARLQTLIDIGAFVPMSVVGSRTAQQMAPFVPYQNGTSVVLVNLADKEFCVAYPGHTDVPNPFVRCQAVRDGYAAGVVFSGEALELTPALFALVRDAIARVAPCIDTLKGAMP